MRMVCSLSTCAGIGSGMRMLGNGGFVMSLRRHLPYGVGLRSYRLQNGLRVRVSRTVGIHVQMVEKEPCPKTDYSFGIVGDCHVLPDIYDTVNICFEEFCKMNTITTQLILLKKGSRFTATELSAL